jgi:hypothetical protein
MSDSLQSPRSLSPYAPQNLAEAEAFAKRLAASPLTPESLRGKPEDIFLIMATGSDLGLTPMASLKGLYVINNRIGIYSALAVSLVKRHGACEHFTLVESTAQHATYKTKRRGETETTLTFTIDQARVAGYLNKGPWRATPEAMLRARAARALAEAVYPDALFGMPWDGDDADEALYDATNSGGLAATEPSPTALPHAAMGTPAAPATAEATPAPAQAAPSGEDALVAELVAAVHAANTLRDLRATGARIAASKLGNRPGLRDAYAIQQRNIRQRGGR